MYPLCFWMLIIGDASATELEFLLRLNLRESLLMSFSGGLLYLSWLLDYFVEF